VTTLAEFLEARYAEREAAAKAAKRDESGNWLASVDGEVFADEDRYVCSAIEVDATHIMLSDPASVLADIAAKRRLLKLHSAEPGQHPGFCWHDKHELPCPTQRLLGAPFAAHPDYQEGWKPGL
jgi:hypothetical protein